MNQYPVFDELCTQAEIRGHQVGLRRAKATSTLAAYVDAVVVSDMKKVVVSFRNVELEFLEEISLSVLRQMGWERKEAA